ncbi:MAG: glycosyltransferase, partial [Candidatus Daviesbacteria bacterium]|nr:glycosyltransferase [Candidatus Daviesbacteria bacterium]
LHISYIHTPPRFLYGYTTSFNYKKHWWTRIGGEIINHFMRIYDFEVSQRPDILVANSKNVQARIKKFYRRDSVVIYPPVEIKKITSQHGSGQAGYRGQGTGKYYLSVGRLVRGKGLDVIVQACDELGLFLKIVGSGPELQNLKSLIVNHKSNIEFLGQVSDEELAKLYAGAKATIVASEDEDFGIVPVESQACGTPVIAPKAGGFLETIVEGRTGEYFNNATAVELMKVLKNFDPKNYQAEDCKKQAQKFGKVRFKKEILELVEKNIHGKN